MSRFLALLAALAVVGPAPSMAADAEEGPFVLKEYTLVCASPDAYTKGLAVVAAAPNKRAARKQLLDDKQCMTVDDDGVEGYGAALPQSARAPGGVG